MRWSAALTPVKTTLGDVLNDPVRHQVPDRHSLRDTLPACGRGDRQRGDLDQADPPVWQARAAQPVPGPGAADEMREFEQFVHVLPGHELLERVGAGDEEELGVRV